MGKLTKLGTHVPGQKNIVFIPGGAGLSPVSFLKLEPYLSGINAYLFWPMGTDGLALKLEPSYDILKNELIDALAVLPHFSLCGHSFGGILACDLVVSTNLPIENLICVATPFTQKIFDMIGKIFSKVQNEDAEKKFESDPSDVNYAKWFAFYAGLYFSEKNVEAGRKMLLQDTMCAKSYLNTGAECTTKGNLLNLAANKKIPKLFVAGAHDSLMPCEYLNSESDLGKFEFRIVPDAGHFVHFDNPFETSSIIKNFIIPKEEK